LYILIFYCREKYTMKSNGIVRIREIFKNIPKQRVNLENSHQ